MRAWMGWCELARAHGGVAAFVGRGRRDQRALVHEALGWALDETPRALVRAFVEGLQSAICASTDPMPVDRARGLLTTIMDRLAITEEPGIAEQSSITG